jgi:hypothetical protein
MDRARTYPGIAIAMVEQWGDAPTFATQHIRQPFVSRCAEKEITGQKSVSGCVRDSADDSSK